MLVKSLNRTKQAIHFKPNKLGFAMRAEGDSLTRTSENSERAVSERECHKDLQKLLGRSAATINRKARLLGIKGTRHYWTEEELKILAERYPKKRSKPGTGATVSAQCLSHQY